MPILIQVSLIQGMKILIFLFFPPYNSLHWWHIWRGRTSVLQKWQQVSTSWIVRSSLVITLTSLHPPSSAGELAETIPLYYLIPIQWSPHTQALESQGSVHWALWWDWAVQDSRDLQDSLGQLSPGAGPASALQQEPLLQTPLRQLGFVRKRCKREWPEKGGNSLHSQGLSNTLGAPIQSYSSVGSPPCERIPDLLPIAIPLFPLSH